MNAKQPQQMQKGGAQQAQQQGRDLHLVRVDDVKHLEALITKAAPHMVGVNKRTPDIKKLVVLARLAAEKNPALLECSASSIFWACVESARCGLAFDGTEGALVPFWNSKRSISEARFMPMVQGLIRAIVRSGAAKSVDAAAVYEGEPFAVKRGTSPSIEHEVRFDLSRSDDKVIAAYVVFTLADGSTKFEVMGREEIEKVKAISQTGRKDFGPWRDWFDQMAIKSVVRRGQKQLPSKPNELLDVIDVDTRVAIGAEPLAVEEARRLGAAATSDMPKPAGDGGGDAVTRADGVDDKLVAAAAKVEQKPAADAEREPGSDG